ncbi:AIPR family protein [Altererythrobacter sp. ZODW24]|uniref:AIPR family protein n=1 Tax=Altererythrobacter sp. ZODW24 TaxID=2185142 RepID=UPI000DF854E5|nr:AIPR family protein [Altererythrobacter sp. ZODW24]
MDDDQLALLKEHLQNTFVDELPPLLQPAADASQNEAKNLARSLSAFTLSSICGISSADASRCVVDDFGDLGIDAIYYSEGTRTLYLVQSKLKSGQAFSQDEANAFSQGVRKLVNSDYNGFNQNVLDRKTEINAALDECEAIQLIVAHTGEALGQYPSAALLDLSQEQPGGEDRIEDPTDYAAPQLMAALRSSQAHARVNCRLVLTDWRKLTSDRTAYIGMVKLSDLAKLHDTHGRALYARNIRASLSHKTPVNRAISKSIVETPDDFEFFNNGVTALCRKVETGRIAQVSRSFKIDSLSIVNGAQTVASAARRLAGKRLGNAASARVLLTIIEATDDRQFGQNVTRFRNFQNAVEKADFIALDDTQERLRRDLAVLGYRYAYQAESYDLADPQIINAQEAAYALAMTLPDPNLPTMAKRNAASLQKVGKYPYPDIFSEGRSATELRNAVLVFRYALARIEEEADAAGGAQAASYRNGAYVIAFILAKRFRNAITGVAAIDPAKLAQEAGPAFDALRQTFWDRVRPIVEGGRDPIHLFKTRDEVRLLVQALMKLDYGLENDPAVHPLEALDQGDDKPYQLRLFRYLTTHAPQIANVT